MFLMNKWFLTKRLRTSSKNNLAKLEQLRYDKKFLSFNNEGNFFCVSTNKSYLCKIIRYKTEAIWDFSAFFQKRKKRH